MGTTVSSGQDNDELIDKLMVSGYIRTKQVEQVFRAVDRADYILPCYKENAYKDFAWKHGNIHLSAPCIYSEVMEGLSLEPGLSFLNLGSGTGYLSTMAGLILRQHGINHGIELHEDCLRYAYERLEEFKQKSLALDEFDFCEPLFIQGNCLSVALDRQYDRVYCGAACPESHEAFIKQFVRVGGILVMPFKDCLLRIQRIDENFWLQHPMLPVSFTTLVIPSTAEQNLVHLPECDPLSLQELCRGKIRHRLRENVWREHGELETTKAILLERERANSPERAEQRVVVPISTVSDDGSSDAETFIRRTHLFFDLDSPQHSITTALLLIRTEVQPTENENLPCVQNLNSPAPGNSEAGNETKEELAPNSENNTESSSDPTCEKSDNQSRKLNNRKAVTEETADEVYSDMWDSDSASVGEETLGQWRKVVNCKKTSRPTRRNVTLNSGMGGSSSNTIQSESETIAHYVDSNAFSTYMKEKIHKLPLPFSLKLYINCNRQL